MYLYLGSKVAEVSTPYTGHSTTFIKHLFLQKVIL